MMTINLMPRTRIERRRKLRRWRAWGIGLATYAGVVMVCALVVNVPAESGIARLRLEAERVGVHAQETREEYETAMKAVAYKSRLLEASRTVGVHPDWSVLLRVITRLRGDRLALSGLQLMDTSIPIATPDKMQAGKAAGAKSIGVGWQQDLGTRTRRESYELRIVGFAAAPSDVTAFARRLEGQSPLRQVRVENARAAPMGSAQVTRFEISCVLREVQAEQESVHVGGRARHELGVGGYESPGSRGSGE